jgi:hypothetical protein
MRLTAVSGNAPRSRPFLLMALLLLLVGKSVSCGHIRPAPEGFNPEQYSAVTIEQLQAPRQAGLASGQKVRVDGFFWQYLEYDPRMAANYLTMVRQPLAWSRLRWAALYRTSSMRGYYDRLALTRSQKGEWDLKRLEQVRVFGQLAPLGFGTLYLQVHHIERLETEKAPVDQGRPLPAGENGETPGS